MARDLLMTKARKQKQRRLARGKPPLPELANQRQSIGASNNFVNDAPRKVRHRNAADLPRALYRRWVLYATGVFLAEFAAAAQSEINFRTSLGNHRTNPIHPVHPVPTPNDEADANVAASHIPHPAASIGTLPRSGLTGRVVARRYGYGNGAPSNLRFAHRQPVQSRPPTNWSDEAEKAFSWLTSVFADATAPSESGSSAWPFPGGNAAPVRQRYKITRSPESGHRHRPHHHHGDDRHHHAHGAATPEPLLHQVLTRIVSRRELGEFLMRENGLDPHALYNHTARSPMSESYRETQPGIDLYIHSQKTEWFVRNYYSPEIEALPDLDDLFWNMIDSVKLQAKHNITRELTKISQQTYKFPEFGGGGVYTLKSIQLSEQPIRQFGSTHRSPIGYVVEVDDYIWDRRESYVIAPAHHPPLVAISTDEDKQIEWLNRHEKLFFNTKGKAPKHRRGISTEEVKRYARLPQLIDDVADHLSKDIVNAFKDKAFGETTREKMVNHLQWHVPFYAAWDAYKKHEHTEAAVRGILDVIAFAGGPFANALKSVGIVLRNGKLVHLAKQMQKIGYLDLPGQVDAAKKKVIGFAAKSAGGPGGKVLADFMVDEMNQSPQLNTLNQIVDAAKGNRSPDKHHSDGVVENT